jgi:glycosyltransferase involved in cell wall biosynthesis
VRIFIFNWKDLAHAAAGGAEVFTEEVARALIARGHEVTLFAAAVDGRPPSEVVGGVQIVRRGGRLGVYREARRFWSAQAGDSFDVVIDEINTRPFMTPRWVQDTPVVALIHQLAREIWFYETPFPVAVAGRYLLEPWWLRSYVNTPTLTVSESSAESLRRYHGWRDVTVVPEGHTPHEVPAVPKEREPTMIFLGRLVAMKRPQETIEAFRSVTERFSSARLWLIGDGPLLARLREAAPAGVEFLGRLDHDDVIDRLTRAHVVVATSVREGWGLSVSEAALCGTPAVGYGVPGLVDSIRASGGELTEPHPSALADALIRFLSGELELRPRVSTVPWPEVADAVEARLIDVVEQRRSRTGHATSPRRVQPRTPD